MYASKIFIPEKNWRKKFYSSEKLPYTGFKIVFTRTVYVNFCETISMNIETRLLQFYNDFTSPGM